jgi:hypothetical protein
VDDDLGHEIQSGHVADSGFVCRQELDAPEGCSASGRRARR